MAGYVRRLDPLINGLANVLLVLPSLLLVLLVAAFTAGGVWQLIITLGLLTWPGYMRLIRASVLSLREREFVKASQLFHGTPFYILRKHLMPFIVPLLRTKFILSFRQAVTMEASLSFLGLGDRTNRRGENAGASVPFQRDLDDGGMAVDDCAAHAGAPAGYDWTGIG